MKRSRGFKIHALASSPLTSFLPLPLLSNAMHYQTTLLHTAYLLFSLVQGKYIFFSSRNVLGRLSDLNSQVSAVCS